MFKVAVPNESNFSVFYSTQQEKRCIGCFRGKYEGNRLNHSWISFNEENVTEEFNKDFNEIMKKITVSGPLKSLANLKKFCVDNNFAKLADGSFGFMITTAGYEYFIRCIPVFSDFNVFIYPYIKN